MAAPQLVAINVHRPRDSTAVVIIGLNMDRLLDLLGRLLRLSWGY
jgi:hypothetical protein